MADVSAEEFRKGAEFVRQVTYQPFVPDSEKSAATLALERLCWPPRKVDGLIKQSLRDWYRRVDPVEFWASVAVLAWYAAYLLELT